MGANRASLRAAVGWLLPPGTRRRGALERLVDTERASGNTAYAAWIAGPEGQREAPAVDPDAGPLFSVVVPAFNTPDRYLQPMIDSVIGQSYPRWELCLVDASTDRGRSDAIRAQASRDPRIRVTRLEQNRGIAANTNAGIEAAAGEYLAFLDHDDTLAPFALNEVAAALQERSPIDLFYSDEDKLSDDGRRRSNPLFKPGWSPDLFYCVNYLAHFVVARSSLVNSVSGLREGFDGAQDYDLLLRLLDRSPAIHHVSRISYHWRMAEGSNARSPTTKGYAQESGRRALAQHLARRGVTAKVEPISEESTAYRVCYALASRPDVHVLTATPGAAPAAAFGGPNDGPSVRTLASPEALHSLPDTDLLVVVEAAGQPAGPGWLEELIAVASQPGVGVVAPGLQDRAGRSCGAGYTSAAGTLLPQLAGRSVSRWAQAGSPGWPRDVLAVGGVGALSVGLARTLADEGTPLALAALSLAAHRRGRRNIHWPFAGFISDAALPSVAGGDPVDDPYRNPNLSPDGSLYMPEAPAPPPL